MTPGRRALTNAAMVAAVIAATFILLRLTTGRGGRPNPGPEALPPVRFEPLSPARRPFAPGEELLYEFAWNGLSCAQCRLTLSEGVADGTSEWVLHYEGSTSEAIQQFWAYRVEGDTHLDPQSLLPTLSVTTSHKGKKGKTVTTTFDRSAGVAEVVKLKLRPSGNRRSVRQVPFEMGLDLPAALLLMRALDLPMDKTTAVEIISSDKLYAAELRPIRRETVQVEAGTFEALVVEMRVRVVEGSRQERAREESKYRHIRLWISEDDARLPLKMESELAVGSVSAELVSARR